MCLDRQIATSHRRPALQVLQMILGRQHHREEAQKHLCQTRLLSWSSLLTFDVVLQCLTRLFRYRALAQKRHPPSQISRSHQLCRTQVLQDLAVHRANPGWFPPLRRQNLPRRPKLGMGDRVGHRHSLHNRNQKLPQKPAPQLPHLRLCPRRRRRKLRNEPAEALPSQLHRRVYLLCRRADHLCARRERPSPPLRPRLLSGRPMRVWCSPQTSMQGPPPSRRGKEKGHRRSELPRSSKHSQLQTTGWA
mmetsp:Transcript_36040/g.91771  ORF Transcript_36040/g.91771 Transcript_36040/m.91771 type:complete len:248 (+) Transcript_36040:772-1515(+)